MYQNNLNPLLRLFSRLSTTIALPATSKRDFHENMKFS